MISKLSRLKGLRTVAGRINVNLVGYRHALAPRRSDVDLLRDALKQDSSEFLDSFRGRTSPRFFFGHDEVSEIVSYVEKNVPNWRHRTIADAEAIRLHVVRLLGVDRFDLKAFVGSRVEGNAYSRIPWHWDVLNDYKWDPATFWQKIETPYDRADIKIPWELSRCQHLPTLGIAYLVSNEPRYAEEVVDQIDDWIRCNPTGYGVNWACTMDVAIRSVNWLWAYHLIALAPAVTDDFLTRFLASLLRHARHISRNIELYPRGLTTNHTLADYVGLFYLGLMLPEFREASSWVETSMKGINRCMELQVTPDGVDFENSIAYHRLVLEMFLGSYVLAKRNELTFPESYRASLRRMLEFVYSYTQPNGLAPVLGDSDDGRLQILGDYFGWKPDDHRYLLAAGGVLFESSRFASAGHGVPQAIEEAAWLVGVDTLQTLQSVPAEKESPQSQAFGDSGRFVMRHDSHYVIVCADEVGTGGLGNHKHNDALSFHLAAHGIPIVVDPGSFGYTADRAWRDRFRSTRFHNTLMVDGIEQNDLAGPFRVLGRAGISIREWRSTSEYDFLEVSHTGYDRLRQPVVHRRRFLFAKEPFLFIVVDDLLGNGEHKVESFLHFAAGGWLGRMDETKLCQSEVQARLNSWGHVAEVLLAMEPQVAGAYRFTRGAHSFAIVPLNWSSAAAEEGWIAPRYGQRVRAPVLRLFDSLRPGMSRGYVIFAQSI